MDRASELENFANKKSVGAEKGGVEKMSRAVRKRVAWYV